MKYNGLLLVFDCDHLVLVSRDKVAHNTQQLLYIAPGVVEVGPPFDGVYREVVLIGSTLGADSIKPSRVVLSVPREAPISLSPPQGRVFAVLTPTHCMLCKLILCALHQEQTLFGNKLVNSRLPLSGMEQTQCPYFIQRI